jgi:imidazolonepropionase-like amidohydrolase
MPQSALPTSTKWTRRILLVPFLYLAVVSNLSAAESSVVIERCSVFDPESGKMLPEQTILIRGTQIIRVAGADEVGDVPANATRIDGRGKFVLLGLIDAHVHVVHVLDFAHVTEDEVLPLYLAAGVTSIRSTGDELVAATLVARFAAAYPESSPRVADIVLLTGNPLDDIRNTRRIELVIHAGQVCRPDVLLKRVPKN